jgi:hypothetical protein
MKTYTGLAIPPPALTSNAISTVTRDLVAAAPASRPPHALALLPITILPVHHPY